ncbi:hypothetical protein GALMADRAFT_143077 [Galerina marginata CBS 339.88]|uniref:Uncharacterized protein n=1 Tax=Galerina marginata (strain CBS 339.88) TaxID=685588 RepID=A0A067SZK8_GALM3|nr:hypothetical protein GALMADRAFT_143077 [Galerina marginata CBS 339.88]
MSHRARIRQWNLGFGPNLSNRAEEMIEWAFQKPAPRLENFEIRFKNLSSRFDLSEKFRLFADNAPSLQHFHAFNLRLQPQTLLSSKRMCALHIWKLFQVAAAGACLDNAYSDNSATSVPPGINPNFYFTFSPLLSKPKPPLSSVPPTSTAT